VRPEKRYLPSLWQSLRIRAMTRLNLELNGPDRAINFAQGFPDFPTDPRIVEAVHEASSRGTHFAVTTEEAVAYGEELCRRFNFEMIRFANSGTEATMFAIRAARAFTGRPLVARFDHSYHGTHDLVMAGTPGVPDAIGSLIVDLPWGDQAGIEAALRGRERELAAVIVEPVQGAGGVRAPEPGYLEYLRRLADRTGALLIFDEIISFRIAPGGAQEAYGVRPDLTTLGKVIAGGYPLAAFGGRADVMEIFDARRALAVSHGGTFNGNPVAAVAGLATLRELTPDVYASLNRLGARLRERLVERIVTGGLRARAVNAGSLFQVFQGEGGAAFAPGAGRPSELYVGLLLEGFMIAPRGMGAVPTVATEQEVDDLADAIARVLTRIEEVSAVPAAGASA
jgi:glutamate-1-semialdehyde 2,1-aminomutase